MTFTGLISVQYHLNNNGGETKLKTGTRVTSSTDGPDTPNSSSPDSLTENVEMERSDPESGLRSSEYTQQYGRIVCGEQRSRYKEDFNSQYDEYRDLFQSIDKVSKRFAKLEEELRQQHEGTTAWQVDNIWHLPASVKSLNYCLVCQVLLFILFRVSTHS